MPHIRLEYTSNLKIENNFDHLFHQFHNLMNEIVGINIKNCKSRAICLKDFYAGNGSQENAFIHLEVSILAGRTIETKKVLGSSLLKTLKKFLENEIENPELQITIEIQDIQKAMYFKHPEASLQY